jgi:rubrerythrin
MTHTELIGGNRWEQALHRHLIAHVEDEGALVAAYEHAAEESQSAAFRYLVTMIIDDEKRHHAVFDDLAKTLQTEVDHRAEEFAIPRLGQWGFERDMVLALTENLLVQEQMDAARLQVLESELEPVKDTTMWPLLVQLMQADTAKHVSILEFVKAQVARTWHDNEGDWEGIEHPSACPA